MVSFGDGIKLGFKNAFKFGGTSTRAEYWWFALFSFIINVAANLVDAMFGIDMSLGGAGNIVGGPTSLVVSLVFLIPQLSLLVRRFRDTKVGPYWLIAALVPIAGLITWITNHSQMFNDIVQSYSMSDAELNALVEQWVNDPAITDTLAQFAVIMLLLAAYGIFQLVVTLLPSKQPKQPVVATTDY